MPITIGSSSDNVSGRVSPSMGTFTASLDGNSGTQPDTDGQLARGLNSFSVRLSDNFFYRWPQVRGMYVISDRNNVLGTSEYTTWTYNSDVVIFQGIYPSPANIDNMVSLLSAQRNNYPNCKFIEYTIPFWGFNSDDTSFNHRRLQKELIYDDYNAEDEWYLKNPTTGGFLEGSGDQAGVRLANVSDVCPTVNGLTYLEAYTKKWFDEFEEDDCVLLFDGKYYDGVDANNAFPQPVDISTGLDYDGVPDYDVDGNADDSQASYRNGAVLLAEEAKFQAAGRYGKANWYIATNGGRDYNHSAGTLSSYEWYQNLGHCRVMETASARIEIEPDGSGGFVTNGAMSTRLFGDRPAGMVRAAAVTNEYLETYENSGIRPYCLIDMPIGGSTGLSINDITEDQWLFMESLHALCMQTEFMMPGPLVNKRQPAPDYDLYIIDTGPPLSTRSLGTLSADGETYTERAVDENDDGGLWYITEFENGYFWYNANPPDSNSVWPQPGNASTLTNLPSPPSGYKGVFFNRNNYTNPTFGLSAKGYASSRYDGSDATSITAGPFEGGFVLWEAL